eukprot:Seg1268.7 transcript_id=Seg1268.7/GoldUCD/mRNA.D3Y31 product="hypothetical protein" protein_id=Seg1268.7/GoldUCD/D3Y31
METVREVLVEPKTAVRLEIENLELLATVESQESMIKSMKEDIQHYGSGDRRSEIQALGQEQQIMDLEQALRSKDLTVQQLKEELNGSQRAVEDVYRKYEQNRKKSDNRENLIRKLQRDMQDMQESLEKAQNEKLDIADKMRQVQNDKASLKLDFDWMREKVQSIEGQDEEASGKDELDSGFLSRSTGSFKSAKTKSFKRYGTSNDGEQQFSSTVEEYYSSSSDDPKMKPVVKQFRDVEGTFRRTMTSQSQDLNREKEELLREFKKLQTQLYDLQREHETYAQKVAEKDQLIERLKAAKGMMETDLDSLVAELDELKTSNEQLQSENTDLKNNLISTRNQVSKLEIEFENEMKQKNYLKEQLENISAANLRSKDDHGRIEHELRDYQRRLDATSRELSNKDSVNQQLKTRVTSIEGNHSRFYNLSWVVGPPLKHESPDIPFICTCNL